MSVGQELLDVPLPKMVADLAMGIAKAQQALDRSSVETALALSEATITYVPTVDITIDERTREDGGSGGASGPPATIQATVVAPRVEDVPLIAFLRPTFYQFSEASIEVSMDIKTKEETSTGVTVGADASVGWGPFSANISVDVEHNRKFGKEVHGTSKLVVRLVPVPPPPLLLARVEVRRIPWDGNAKQDEPPK